MAWLDLAEDIEVEFGAYEPDIELAYLRWGAELEAEHRDVNRRYANDKTHTNSEHAQNEAKRAIVVRVAQKYVPQQAVLLATPALTYRQLVQRDRAEAHARRIRMVAPARTDCERAPTEWQLGLFAGRVNGGYSRVR